MSLLEEFAIGGCHAGQTKRIHLLQCRMCQHLMSFLLVVGFAADIAVRRRRLARSRYVETDVLLIFSRSETARIDNPCSNVSRRIDRISFTSVCLACFRLGIMSSLKTRGQSADRRSPKSIKLHRDLCPRLTWGLLGQ
jgi:hypothetical protein